MKMWMLNLGKPVNVPQLNDAMAIDLGANILGEGIIFIVAAGVLYMEYARQVRKEEKKEASRKQELSTLNYTIQELYFQLERQDAQIRELHRTINTLETEVVRKPWKQIKPGSPSSTPPPSPPTDPESKPPPPAPPIPLPQAPSGLVNPISAIKSTHPNTLLHQHHHHHHHHHDVIPIHLEHFNKVVTENPGVVLTAVAYLTNDIFNFKRHEYYSEIHLHSQH